MCVSSAMNHAINGLRLQALATVSMTSLLYQRVLPPHGTNIPLVGWWHADVLWSLHILVNKSEKFQRNISFQVHLGAHACAPAVLILKLSGSLNNALPCAKNNVQRQLVEMITCSEVNYKFPHKQTLTEYIIKPMISSNPPLNIHVL